MGLEKEKEIFVHGSKVRWLRLKHSGLYDIEKLLSVAKAWFNERKYTFVETEHSEAVKSAGKEGKMSWTPFRNINNYLRYWFEFEIVIYREVDVVAEDGGRKLRMQQGDLEFRLKTKIIKNYRNTFRGPGKEFMRQTYEKYLIRRELRDHMIKLQAEGDDLLNEVKKVLGSFRR